MHSTNSIDRLDKEVKRRTHIVGIFPNRAALMLIRFVGTLLAEQDDTVTGREPSLLQRRADPEDRGARRRRGFRKSCLQLSREAMRTGFTSV